jgi:hypothetical protein
MTKIQDMEGIISLIAFIFYYIFFVVQAMLNLSNDQCLRHTTGSTAIDFCWATID